MSRPEFEFIHWIAERTKQSQQVLLGIGDDAALLQTPTGNVLVAADMLMEGVHFTAQTPPELIGRKGLAVNLSDLAAMGGSPQAAFVTLALPRKQGVAYAQQVMNGVLELAERYQVAIAGGDTNIWDGPLVISVTVTGEICGTRCLTRSGSQPGDWIFVTGSLGGSLAGKHLTFTPRLAVAQKLSTQFQIHSMLDISDGLAVDLPHLLQAAQLSAIIYEDKIPLAPVCSELPLVENTLMQLLIDRLGPEIKPGALMQQSALCRALSDGEDFELLFTVSPQEGQQLLEHWQDECPISWIGEIVHSEQHSQIDLEFPNQQRILLPPAGWTHSW